MTRWSSKRTDMCVSELTARWLYLHMSQGQHTQTLTHKRCQNCHGLRVCSKSDEQREKECDNAFTPHHARISLADSSISQRRRAAEDTLALSNMLQSHRTLSQLWKKQLGRQRCDVKQINLDLCVDRHWDDGSGDNRSTTSLWNTVSCQEPRLLVWHKL